MKDFEDGENDTVPTWALGNHIFLLRGQQCSKTGPKNTPWYLTWKYLRAGSRAFGSAYQHSDIILAGIFIWGLNSSSHIGHSWCKVIFTSPSHLNIFWNGRPGEWGNRFDHWCLQRQLGPLLIGADNLIIEIWLARWISKQKKSGGVIWPLS